ncbi:MAG: ABC transporter permease, partial [Chitinophagales bacterium]
MRIFLKLTRESILIAFQEIANNRLRAFLSLLGISIGIFCIISVYTSVDSLEKNVRNSFQKLGNDVVYIQKFPWTDDSRMSWWKFYRRPSATYNEFQFLKENMQTAEGVSIMMMLGSKTIKYRNESTENTPVTGATFDYKLIRDFEFEQGRYFSYSEMQRGQAVAIIGHQLAELLFPNPEFVIGKKIRLMNRDIEVIGVLKKEGEDIVGFSSDDRIFVPYNYLKTLVNTRSGSVDPFIAIKSKPEHSLMMMQDEARGLLRSYRKLKPKEEDNFAMNKLSIISGALNMVFGVINIAGAVIG